MKTVFCPAWLAALALLGLAPGPLLLAAEAPTLVTAQNFIRAETDRMFFGIARQAGGVNQFYHYRKPTPLDQQSVVRMNRDTLYSMAVVDTRRGASIRVPELPGDRYVSVYLVDNDHYVPRVIYSAGVHPLPSATRYLGVAVRIQLHEPDDPREIALVNSLQDQFVIQAGSAEPLPPLRWDMPSLDRLRAQYEQDARQYPSWKGMQGPRGKVNEKTRHIAAAAAWGLFPERDATYLNYNGGFNAERCYTATYQIPENRAFWSITLYGKDGFMQHENSLLNASNVVLDPDGGFTAYFGSREVCGEVPNRLDTSDGWNFLMRIYRPGPSVLDGRYQLPAVRPVE
ncbi:DUF1254 domain-containing protein [Pseudomonas sp. N040]|uniref:DUF1254 domain-containing protein n=1 Tax=Pseudomonas sp. N040 TaxID=2785325 RepID=UPI0018A28810|nr:DUF1254 domain-containing protein [Pseudomonas sp. N040]MBF7731556.1 DUF1254 domain-containing protein [Pseudomonas sp. N040]MBW7015200.1 DUF1254 domain-containing protein [Pseudomonas sp. N040]